MPAHAAETDFTPQPLPSLSEVDSFELKLKAARTKAEQAEAITAVEGMAIGDQKGSAKPHPMALLARDYRAQAATTLQRILSNLGG